MPKTNMDYKAGSRFLQTGAGRPPPHAPRLRNLRARRRADFPALPAVYLDLAEKLSSPLRGGPPLCDELLAFVQHVFSEEEAAAARHLGSLRGRTAADLARLERRPVEQVEPLLQRLATEKRVIAATGSGEQCTYRLLPVVPGMFEMCLVSHTLETLTDWHRRFIELFEVLYETGFALDYLGASTHTIRVLPVNRAIEAHPMALPSDHLETILDRYRVFGIGQCQCRTTAEVLGRGCGRPRGNCLVMGRWAVSGIKQGALQSVSRQAVLDLKREAEAHGLANWLMNVESSRGQISCSCCGCCCHAFRLITEFNAPGLIAPPHFLPQFDAARCSHCGRCAQICPLNAIRLDAPQKSLQHLTERCVGCGLCAVACPARAVRMDAAPTYRPPYRNWLSLALGTAPRALRSVWNAWRKRG